MGYLIPDDWDGITWCNAVVCWPRSEGWNSILNGLITSLTRGRNWDSESGSILYAQAIGYEILDRNIQAGCEMSCLDDLNQTLENLVQVTLSAGGCGCGGSGGAGGTDAEASTFEDDGTNFPDGYSDRPAYDVAKCNLAQYVINNILSDFDKLKTIDPTTLTIAGSIVILVALLTLPLSFVALSILAASLLAFATLGGAALVTAINELQARIAAMDICELYEANNVGEAISNVEAWIAGGTYTNPSLTIPLGQALIGTDTLNPLFNPPDPWLLPEGLPTGDCSGCLDCLPVYVSVGTIVSQSANSITVQGVPNAGLNRASVLWNVEETSPGNYAYCDTGVTITGMTTSNNLGGGSVEANPDNSLIDDYHFYPPNGNLPNPPYANVGRILHAFNTGQNGTVTFTWS